MSGLSWAGRGLCVWGRGGELGCRVGLGITGRLDGQEREIWAVSGNLRCIMLMFDFHDFLRF